jgi:hypothetical protein
VFPHELKNFFFYFCELYHWNFDGVCTLYVAFDSMIILNNMYKVYIILIIFILLIHEHEKSFYFLVSSIVSPMLYSFHC